MFYTLLLVTFAIAAAVSWICARIFARPAGAILRRLIQDEIHRSWLTYLVFALYVVGISRGVRITHLQQFISPQDGERRGVVLALTPERWTLEVYRTVIGALQGAASVLLVFFVVALVAFALVRLAESRRRPRGEEDRRE